MTFEENLRTLGGGSVCGGGGDAGHGFFMALLKASGDGTPYKVRDRVRFI